MIEHIDKQTPNGVQFNLEALYKIAPSCFTEAKGEDGELHRVVDFTKLRQLLGDAAVEDAPEVYDFTWVGKRAAMREAAAPIRKTLRPCPEESVDWDTTQNLYIEGDNLEVLKLLQNSYMGKIKMIYIDPPYNTGNDFVYQDDFHRSQKEEDETAGVINEKGERMIRNTESNGKFHSDWCSMIFARLLVARSLLKEDGLICISIDHHELVNLTNICDNIFSEGNRVGILSVVNNLKGRSDDAFFATCNEFLLVYAKNKSILKLNGFKLDDEELDNDYEKQDEIGYYKLIGFRKTGNAWQREERPLMYYPVLYKDGEFSTAEKSELEKIYNSKTATFDDEYVEELHQKYSNLGYRVVWPVSENGDIGRWRWGVDTFMQQKEYNLDFNNAGTLCTKMRATFEDGSIRVKSAKTLWYKPEYDTGSAAKVLKRIFGKADLFDNPKSLVYIKDIMTVATGDNDLVLDFFSGSATAAHAVMQLNAENQEKRRFILIQWPEDTPDGSAANKAGYKTICEIGKERIRLVGKEIKKERTFNTQDLDTGFRVFKCDESNYKEVAFTPKDYSQESLDLFTDNIKDDRSDLDLLFDCMLRWGVELSMPLKSSNVDGCTIHNVDDGNLVACLNGTVTEKVIDVIASMSPLRVVFRDSSFTEAAAKMNLFELFKQKCGWSETEVRNNVRVI